MDLSYNQIESIPESFWNLSTWWSSWPGSILDFSHNKLSNIPTSLCNDYDDLQYLHDRIEIDVDRNCLTEEYYYDCIDTWGTQDGCE